MIFEKSIKSKKICLKVKKTIGNVQILVNNAGIVTGKKFLDSTDIEIERTFKVNTLAHFWVKQKFIIKFKNRIYVFLPKFILKAWQSFYSINDSKKSWPFGNNS